MNTTQVRGADVTTIHRGNNAYYEANTSNMLADISRMHDQTRLGEQTRIMNHASLNCSINEETLNGSNALTGS